MQVVVDGGAVAGHFGECFGEFEAVGNEDIAAELTLARIRCSCSAVQCAIPATSVICSRGMSKMMLPASMPTTRSAMRSKSLVMWLESSTPRSPVEA